MITKYFKSVIVRIPPVGHAAKMGRVFMANLPPRVRSEIKVDFKLLDVSATNPELKAIFKDGSEVSVDLSNIGTSELMEAFDRQSRKLLIQDTIKE